MYLRLPWVLGSVGLARTLLIVALSVSITLITGLSISAIATNMKVGGGGAYYMISRTFGLEAGAAIGLPLFFAQALGIAFYIVGFAEAVVGYIPGVSIEVVGIATLVTLTALASFSAKLALKGQFVILTVLMASLASVFLGGEPSAPGIGTGEAIAAGSFWVAFAVFFPAVTGIEAGLGMSGDLKDPARSLPRGTLLAIGTGLVIYAAIPIFLSQVIVDHTELLNDSLILTRVARWASLVVLGILGATLSSALGALLGAPRTLQALAQDRVLPRFLGRGYGPGRDPRLATVVAFLIAGLGIMLGDLNAIAPVLSMFFLTSYGVLNFSAGIEALIAGPAWRPTFRVHWSVSLIGCLACVAAMLMINPGATFIAIFASAVVYLAVQRRSLNARWSDIRYGLLVLVARAVIQALARRTPHERSWNPNILVLAGTPSKRWHLVLMGQALAGETGLLTIATVVPDEFAEQTGRLAALREGISKYLEERRVAALVKVHADDSVANGLLALVKSYGFGPLVPNTILMGKADGAADPKRHAELLSAVQRRRRNIVVVHEAEDIKLLSRAERIDLWWGGNRANSGLMLALAFLLKKHPVWEDAQIVVHRVIPVDADTAIATADMNALLSTARFAAKVHVLAHAGEPLEAARIHSQQADLVFLGMRPRKDEESLDDYSRYYTALAHRTEGLPPTALVTAADEVDLHRLFSGN